MKVDDNVLRRINKSPIVFAEICAFFRFTGIDWREIDMALRRLRKAGKIKYLKKADGGPGWVRI